MKIKYVQHCNAPDVITWEKINEYKKKDPSKSW